MTNSMRDLLVIDAFTKEYLFRKPQHRFIAHSDHASYYCTCVFKGLVGKRS